MEKQLDGMEGFLEMDWSSEEDLQEVHTPEENLKETSNFGK